MKDIRTIRDLHAEVTGSFGWGMTDKEMLAAVSRRVYKATECGAFVALVGGAIVVGSIVEGTDAEVSASPLNFPFHHSDFWNAVDWVNQEASNAWNEAHQAEDGTC